MKRESKIFVVFTCVVIAVMLASCASAVATPDPKAAKPSNAGGTGEALKLTGNVENGKKIFADRCAECHGEEGKGGVVNEGSTDGTIPALNPIDETMVNEDGKVFAANIDLFVEHGSTPEGDNPTKVMMAFGDLKILQPQEIADVIAYVISLNKK